MPAAEASTIEQVAAIYRRVLDTDAVQAESDFFDLGGDSLLATRVISAIARDLGPELTITDFLKSPTPRSVAELIASLTA
ncbi:phosphopantetheine-containing protein [Streptomyces yokosukanensis]|uniref:Phosphopantetheine-containing protein n=1 Tax=Streptomyces yokosukanensis TaxID=67386 RepID=A0A101NTJ1_9ACTN|nr:phosphopantetheine-binding protein [Streptomyces yokosukanensis]KUM99129.1 phosphopantetheine-containing protein [Streptomyces yokosukanensis]